MKFTKMHGTGNDYIYVNGFEEKLENPSEAAVKLSDRRFGIGSDGLILILPSDVADCRMEMFNADGSIGKMCGNGIRCVAKYVYDRGLVKKDVLRVETRSGVKTLQLRVEDGKVASVRSWTRKKSRSCFQRTAWWTKRCIRPLETCGGSPVFRWATRTR